MRFILTGGQAGDALLAIPLLNGVEATHVIADKGYDSDKILGFIRWQGATPVIPPKSSRRILRVYDWELYKRRNLVERASNKLKHWRRIATRYDRRSLYSLAALHLVSTVIWGMYLSISTRTHSICKKIHPFPPLVASPMAK